MKLFTEVIQCLLGKVVGWKIKFQWWHLLNMSDSEDDTIRILTTLNVIKMPAYFWYLSANASRLQKSLQILQNLQCFAVWEEKLSAVKI